MTWLIDVSIGEGDVEVSGLDNCLGGWKGVLLIILLEQES